VAVGLTRARIVDTALELMDEHGVDWLTMRRLAEHLGVTAPTLYWHIRNRSELIDAAIDAALVGPDGTIDDHAPGTTGSWQDDVRGFMHALRRRLTAHPSVTHMTQNRYPPSVHQLTVRAVSIIEGMGLPPAATAERTRLMIWQVIGFATMENNIRLGTAYHEPVGDEATGTFTVTAPPGAPDSDGGEEAVDGAVDEHLSRLDLDELFRLSVEVFVSGLEHLSQPGPTRARRR
jgi:AcrR family transcriptional regulator